MQIHSIKMRGMGPFEEEVCIDLDKLPGRFIAVTGRNGEGKTFAVETGIAGAVYRTMPTQGKLVKRAHRRDSMLETKVSFGTGTVVLKHLIDGVASNSEATVLDEAGQPLTTKSKVSEFDTWVEAHLPPPDLLFASLFGAQESNNFIAAKTTERTKIILRAKGIEHYEKLHKLAKDHVAAAEKEFERVVGLIAGMTTTDSANGDAIAKAEAELEQRTAELLACRAALTEVQKSAEDWRTTKRERDALLARIAEVRASEQELSKQLADTREKIANNRMLVEKAGAIRAAEARSPELEKELHTAQSAAHDIELKAQAARSTVTRLRDAARAASDAASRAQSRIQSAVERLRDEKLVLDAVDSLEGLRKRLAEAQDAERNAAEQLQALRATRLAGAEERIVVLRGGLSEIACSSDIPVEVAKDTLRGDDEVVARAAALPAELAAAEKLVKAASLVTAAAKQDVEAAERLAARQEQMTQLRSDMATAEKDRDAQDAESKAKTLAAEESDRTAQALKTQCEQAAGVVAKLSAERASLQGLLRFVGPLQKAEGRIAELEPVLAEQTERREVLAAQIAALVADTETPLPAEPSLDAATKAVAEAERRHQQATAAVATAKAVTERFAAESKKILALEDERARIEWELADWVLIRDSLGRKGLQAAEVDEAGPELTDIVNELLHECHGPRFTATITTQRPSSDGKRMLEECDFNVIDTHKGTEKDARYHSKGEQALLGVAISFALCVLACRKSGVKSPTLVRDESDAPLDEVNAKVFVEMLRRAADMVKASKVLVITHSREVLAAADSRIVIDGGRIEAA